MAKLIVKSPYIKCTGSGDAAGAGGYLYYIGTREHVQKLNDDRQPTRKQEQFIAKLMKDFPSVIQLEEYGDYEERKTKVTSSVLITMALEENWQAVSQMDGYVNYIATRPRAERLGAHGLFGDEDSINLKEAMAELNSYTGNVWTHIISLHREDAARLGYDSAQAWRNLIRARRNDIAAAMKISPKDFRWYAAFHDEGEHPHIHMLAWSAKPGQAYLSREGIRQIKSVLTNDIFKQELLHVYEQKSASRDELVRQARREMLELVRTMQAGLCDHPEVEALILQLAQGLETVRGKKSYGYLPKLLKALTDKIVDQMERIPAVAQCYEKWLTLQGQVDSYYGGSEHKRLKLSQQKEFRAIKNAVIQEAERIRTGEITFEDEDLSAADEPESTRYNAEFYIDLPIVLGQDAIHFGLNLRRRLFICPPVPAPGEPVILVNAVCAADDKAGMAAELINLAINGELDIGILRLNPDLPAVVAPQLITERRTGAHLMVSVNTEEGDRQFGEGFLVQRVPSVAKIIQTGIAEDDEHVFVGEPFG